MKNPKKNILIIAGSDSVGGAGIQADIKTCEAYGCYSATAITALTAQNTSGVSAVMPVTPEFLNAQLEAVCAELKFDAVKIGMLFNEQLIACVKAWLEQNRGISAVIDPVCVAKSGAKLLQDGAINALKELLSLARIATPNLDEARILGLNFDDERLNLGADLPCDVVLKRTQTSAICEDTLYKKSGEIVKFNEPLEQPTIMHGAGCSFSAAIACALACGADEITAIRRAKAFVANAIKNAHGSNFGVRLLDHKAAGANRG